MNHTLPKDYLLHNRYLIQEVLGQGGFGITYKAQDQVLNITICIKELYISGHTTRGATHEVIAYDTDSFTFKNYIEKFILEARQLAKFRHDNIVRVIDVFETNQTAYLVMEYVEGVTLKQSIQQFGARSMEQSLPLVLQLTSAIETIHKKGMLHRDIKPSNIIITKNDRAVLIDFGSVRSFSEGKTITQTTILTPGYAPPEQYSDRTKLGTFSDIYALGATLYYTLTGKQPMAVTDRIHNKLTPPHEINNTISSQVSSVILLAMEMKQESRFQTIQEFKNALLQVNEQTPVLQESNQSPPSIPKDSIKKKKTINFVVQLFILFLLIGFSIFGYYQGWLGALKISPNTSSQQKENQNSQEPTSYPPGTQNEMRHYPYGTWHDPSTGELMIFGDQKTYWSNGKKEFVDLIHNSEQHAKAVYSLKVSFYSRPDQLYEMRYYYNDSPTILECWKLSTEDEFPLNKENGYLLIDENRELKPLDEIKKLITKYE